MKTSVIEVHEMLSVLSVDEVEKRIGEVPGVEAVTVNFAAKSATVRYDETRLEIGDIKSAVRQRGYESAAEGHKTGSAPSVKPAPAGLKTDSVAPITTPPPSAPIPASPKSTPAAAAPKADAGHEHEAKMAKDKH
jgi:Cu2+-exporting ATPase